MAKFEWMGRVANFWNKTVGNIIPRFKVRQTAERVVGQSPTGDWANQVFSGELPVGDWQTTMRKEIKTRYIQQYLAGRGGTGPMTQADYGSIGGMIADQYRYLDRFALEVAEGKLSEVQIARRSEMYLNSSREAYERGQKRAMEIAGRKEVQWINTPGEICPDCKDLAALGWQRSDPWPFRVGGRQAYPGSGATICLTNCRCHLNWRKGEGRDETT